MLIDIEEAHTAACRIGKGTYIDPVTGYTVITELAHRKRGKCCGNGCRHCPFGHFNVKPIEGRKLNIIKTNNILRVTNKKRIMVGLRNYHQSHPADMTTNDIAATSPTSDGMDVNNHKISDESVVVHVLF